jgi:hypothetical protein
MSEQLEAIEAERKAKEAELTTINTALSQADSIKKGRARIAELEAEEKSLAQKIANIDKQLQEIQDYQQEISSIVESAVNGKFSHVKFKLFNNLINGSIEDCCEATLNGVPYPDCSYGQKILIGIDIINVLAEHYEYSVPLFIDNAESLTIPIEAKSQTIKLFAVDGIKGLEFSKESKSAAQSDLFTTPKTANKKGKKVTTKV